jgi:hypothetical protein
MTLMSWAVNCNDVIFEMEMFTCVLAIWKGENGFSPLEKI